LQANNGASLYIDTNAVIDIQTSLPNGYLLALVQRSELRDLGIGEIAFTAGIPGSPVAYNFASLVTAAQASYFDFDGTIAIPNLSTINGNSFLADGNTLVSVGTLVPGGSGYSLTNSSQLVGAFSDQAPIAGSHITGNVSVAGQPFNFSINCGLSNFKAALGADVALNNTGNFFDGPKISQGSTGTWDVCGSVMVEDTSAAAQFSAKLWDGTQVFATGVQNTFAANKQTTITLCAKGITPTGDLRISVNDSTSTNGLITHNTQGSGVDSVISADRIN